MLFERDCLKKNYKYILMLSVAASNFIEIAALLKLIFRFFRIYLRAIYRATDSPASVICRLSGFFLFFCLTKCKPRYLLYVFVVARHL